MPESSTAARVKLYRPYFSPAEVERLSAKQRGKLSVSREEKGRQQAGIFIDAVGTRCGFPRKTIATAQTLYMRFHLFFPYRDFNHTEVSLSCLYVSSKLHDTLKKPRDIILQSYPLRFPHLVKKGTIDPTALNARMLEDERLRVLTVERLVLETICFKFEVDTAIGIVIKIAKALELDKTMSQQAWRVVVDFYRTTAPLSYPSHLVALAGIYAAALLSLETTDPSKEEPADTDIPQLRKQYRSLVAQLSASGTWEEDYATTADLVDDVTHYILDLYITVQSLPAPTPQGIEPSPGSPGKMLTPSNQSASSSTAFALPPSWTAQTLTELKIYLRNKRPGKAGSPSWPSSEAEDIEMSDTTASEGFGQNEGTVRFLWDKAEIKA